MSREVVGHWSYSGDPSVGDRDRVRWLVGDTNKKDQLVSDEEIDAALDESGNNYTAAAEIADSIAAFFAREVTRTVSPPGGQNVTTHLNERRLAYEALGDRLRKRGGGVVTPYCGGISVADKDTVSSDTDRVAPHFERGQHEYT